MDMTRVVFVVVALSALVHSVTATDLLATFYTRGDDLRVCEHADTCVYDSFTGDYEDCSDLVTSERTIAGQVCVSTVDDSLQVCFDTEGTGYYLNEVDAWTGDDLESVPRTREGMVDVKKFTARAANLTDGLQQMCVSIPLVDMDAQCCFGNEYRVTTYHLLSHANVYTLGNNGFRSPQSVWGSGRTDLNANKLRFWHSAYNMSCSCQRSTPQVGGLKAPTRIFT
jgi:hypothetical protein